MQEFYAPNKQKKKIKMKNPLTQLFQGHSGILPFLRCSGREREMLGCPKRKLRRNRISYFD